MEFLDEFLHCVQKNVPELFTIFPRPQLENIPWWSKNILSRGTNARLEGGAKIC